MQQLSRISSTLRRILIGRKKTKLLKDYLYRKGMALDFVAGCIGGAAGVLVGHPFDTVKVGFLASLQ